MTGRAFGEFEHQVLLALLALDGRAYTAPIVMALEEATGRAVSPAAVFIALRRLEERGLARSTKRPAAPGEGGRGRRIFAVTPAGLARLREARATLQRLWSAGPLAELP